MDEFDMNGQTDKDEDSTTFSGAVSNGYRMSNYEDGMVVSRKAGKRIALLIFRLRHRV